MHATTPQQAIHQPQRTSTHQVHHSGWMDGCMNEWMNGWMYEWMDDVWPGIKHFLIHI